MYIYFCAAALNVDLFVLLEVECGSVTTLSLRTTRPIEIESSYLLLWIIFQTAINSRGVFINLSLLSLFQVSGEANYLRCLWQMKAVDVSKHARWQMGNQLRPTVLSYEAQPYSKCAEKPGTREQKKHHNSFGEEITIICTLSAVLIKNSFANTQINKVSSRPKTCGVAEKIFALLSPWWTISQKNLSGWFTAALRCAFAAAAIKRNSLQRHTHRKRDSAVALFPSRCQEAKNSRKRSAGRREADYSV